MWLKKFVSTSHSKGNFSCYFVSSHGLVLSCISVCVSICVYPCVLQSFAETLAKNQKCKKTFVDFDICHGMALLQNILLDPDLLFKGQTFETLISLKWIDLAKNEWDDFCRFFIFAIEWPPAKIILGDVDLLFEGHKFKNVNISEMMRASAKIHQTTLTDFYICPRMAYAKIVLSDVGLLSEGQIFETIISLKYLELTQNAWDDFCRFWYYHRLASLRHIIGLLRNLDLLVEGANFHFFLLYLILMLVSSQINKINTLWCKLC